MDCFKQTDVLNKKSIMYLEKAKDNISLALESSKKLIGDSQDRENLFIDIIDDIDKFIERWSE